MMEREYRNCKKSHVLPLQKRNSIPCVCISFSVNVNRGFQDSLGSQLITHFSHLGSQGGKLGKNLLVNILWLPGNGGDLLVLLGCVPVQRGPDLL